MNIDRSLRGYSGITADLNEVCDQFMTLVIHSFKELFYFSQLPRSKSEHSGVTADFNDESNKFMVLVIRSFKELFLLVAVAQVL